MGLVERPLNPQDRSSLAIAPWIDRIDAN